MNWDKRTLRAIEAARKEGLWRLREELVLAEDEVRQMALFRDDSAVARVRELRELIAKAEAAGA
jgi:hypothetical protein